MGGEEKDIMSTENIYYIHLRKKKLMNRRDSSHRVRQIKKVLQNKLTLIKLHV